MILLSSIIISCQQQGELKLDRAATTLSSGMEIQIKALDANNGETASILLNVRTTDEGDVMELRMDGPDGEIVSEIRLPHTIGQ